MTVFLIWLYGLSAWGAVCNLPAWAALIARWFTDSRDAKGRRLPVRYLLARIGLLLASFGILFSAAIRGSSLMQDLSLSAPTLYVSLPHWREPFLTSTALPVGVQAAWVGCFVVSEVLFLVTAALAGRVKGLRPLWLGVYVVGAVVWTIAVCWP